MDGSNPSSALDIPAYHAGFSSAESVSLAFVVTLGVSLFVLSIVLFVRTLSRKKMAKAMRAAANFDALEVGTRSLQGTVEFPKGSHASASVEFVQTGTERNGKHGWHHSWRSEGEVVLTALPFYLRLTSGERVLVEVFQSVELNVQRAFSRVDQITRRCIAAIEPGQQVNVYGHLRRGTDEEAPAEHQGYRGATKRDGWVIGAMLISDSDPSEGYEKRSRFHRNSLGAFFLLSVALALALSGFVDRVGRGEVQAAQVVALHIDDSGKSTNYMCEVVLESGETYRDMLNEDSWRRLHEGVWIRVLFTSYSVQFGSRPTLSLDAMLGGGFLFGMFVFFYVLLRKSSRPWHRRTPIEDGGVGRLNTDTG